MEYFEALEERNAAVWRRWESLARQRLAEKAQEKIRPQNMLLADVLEQACIHARADIPWSQLDSRQILEILQEAAEQLAQAERTRWVETHLASEVWALEEHSE